MFNEEDRFAVIGAGFSGLGIAAALQRHRIPFEVFEANDDLGGNWYRGVYETVHIISSRRTTEYTDYPMPAEWPDFPSKDQMLAYLRDFAEHHRLREHIRFSTRVERVEPTENDRWRITLTSGEVHEYAGVIVANGHHWAQRWPTYPGEFAGHQMHSKEYTRGAQLEGQRVLVVGGGNSACDIAVEAARVGAAAHISMRRGYWFLPKTLFGVPTVEIMKPWMPISAQRLLLKGLLRVVVGRYEDYGLPHPDHRIFERHPTVNSELLYNLRHGRIAPHPDIERFEGHRVHFVDGSHVDVDTIVYATGYHLRFPFLADGIVEWNDGIPDLLNGVVPRRHRNLYVFGIGQPRYGAGPLISAGAETLCRLIEAQRQIPYPIGQVLERMGARPLTSFLLDPHEVLRKSRQGQRMIPRIPEIAPLLMERPAPAGRKVRAWTTRAFFQLVSPRDGPVAAAGSPASPMYTPPS